MWWLALACGTDPEPGADSVTDSVAGDESAPPEESTPTGESTADSPGDSDPDTPPAEPPAGALVWDGVTVVDADGAAPDRAVIVVGERIWDVRAAGGPWPAEVEVMEADGRWIVPGLMDAHVHLAHSGATVWTGDPLDANLRASLYHGVTAVYDVGGPVALFELRDAVAGGTLLGPEVRATGPFLTTVLSHPCERWPDPDLCVFVEPDDAAAAVDALAAAGADGVKLALADAAFTPWPTPRLDLDAVSAITGGTLPVFAHVDADEDVIDAVARGVRHLAHPPFAGPAGPEAVSAAVSADAIHTTVGAFAAVGALLDGTLDLEDPDLVLGPGVLDNWAWVRAHPEVLEDGWAEASAEWAATARANLVTLRAAGATLLPGSDAGYYFQPHGLGLHRELAALVELGWTPEEALVDATWTSRRVLGLEGGRVRAGEPADLLLLTADPVLDVAALQAIETVILRGVPWARGDLISVDLQAAGDPCLEDADCSADEACDGVDHRCVPACAPTWDLYGSCDEDSWCMPRDGVDAAVGACHEETSCDLYAQDCTPAEYGQACVPLDHDTTTCWIAGPRTAGETCSWDDEDRACAPGLFCSWIDGTCYTLCDPDAPDVCPGRERCVEQEAAVGVPWFGLCL